MTLRSLCILLFIACLATKKAINDFTRKKSFSSFLEMTLRSVRICVNEALMILFVSVWMWTRHMIKLNEILNSMFCYPRPLIASKCSFRFHGLYVLYYPTGWEKITGCLFCMLPNYSFTRNINASCNSKPRLLRDADHLRSAFHQRFQGAWVRIELVGCGIFRHHML